MVTLDELSRAGLDAEFDTFTIRSQAVSATTATQPVHHEGMKEVAPFAIVRLPNIHQSLLINFNVHRLVDGLKSFVL